MKKNSPPTVEDSDAKMLRYLDDSLSPEEQRRYVDEGLPFEFSHTLEDLIGGQISAGLAITGFYEDTDDREEWDPLGRYMATYLATRAVKLVGP